MKMMSLSFIICLSSFSNLWAQAPAFPGAEGHGRYVMGGRGGNVVHVTNLNDSGEGSFRQAVSGSAKKIVVFDVGGVIALTRDVNIGENTTILGQTAPAPGITLRYYTIQPSGNNVIRFIRGRRGQEKDVNDGADAIWQRNKTGIIIDHCSFSWSIDEVASFYDNNNFTMQWCTIGESLNDAGHGKGAHGYGGIWGGKLASFHHNLICHVNNRSPRFNGARYEWKGYTGNKLYSEYKWANEVQAENVDFRNCVIYNCGNGCYGGPGGGYINIVNNYYKTGPAATTSRVTQVTVGASGNAEGHPNLWTMTSRYFISGNQMNATANFNGWSNISYDSGTYTIDGDRWSPDPNHYYGDTVTYKKNSAGTDCVRIRLDGPTATGLVTTHTAAKAFDKVLTYSGASLNPDEVDTRYFSEARNGTATYSGSVSKKKGRIDLVSDVNGYTEETFGTGSREAGFDSDNDGIADAWETANGLNPNDASDALTYSLDPKKWYTNLEVYANSLVQDIMLNGNAEALDAVSEYYPAHKKEDGTEVAVIEGGSGSQDDVSGKSYTVFFNGSDVQTTEGFFSFGTSDNKHNFNSKFTGKYDGMDFTQGLKMEGSTVIDYATEATSSLTIVQSTWSDKTLTLDGTELSLSSATTPDDSEGVRVYTVEDVNTGAHQIKRGNGESGVFLVRVQYYGTSGVSPVEVGGTVVQTNCYNLQGQRVDNRRGGLLIQTQRMADGRVVKKKVVK
ncbi:MAG: pectate lyase [Prevotella sp.]